MAQMRKEDSVARATILIEVPVLQAGIDLRNRPHSVLIILFKRVSWTIGKLLLLLHGVGCHEEAESRV